MNHVDETPEYRVLITHEVSRNILVRPVGGTYVLPRVIMPPDGRLGLGFQQAIREQLRLETFVVDLWTSHAQPRIVIFALVLLVRELAGFLEVPPDEISEGDLPPSDRDRVMRVLHGQPDTPVLGLGWWREADSWVRSITNQSSLFADIDQYNAGAGFSLLRFVARNAAAYWLKATAKPNEHEFPITMHLSSLCPGSLPTILGAKPEWNAWLTEEQSRTSPEHDLGAAGEVTPLQAAVVSMARLQLSTVASGSKLCELGAVDHRTPVLRQHLDELFEYLEEAMNLQTSTKVPALDRCRLLQIKGTLQRVCDRSEEIDIHDTILHGDVHLGNMVMSEERACFLDWSEAYFGQPFITLQHILLLHHGMESDGSQNNEKSLKSLYADVFSEACSRRSIEESFPLMPMLAALSTLYGRGTWIRDSRRNDPRRQARARTLARYMDRAARNPELLAAIGC